MEVSTSPFRVSSLQSMISQMLRFYQGTDYGSVPREIILFPIGSKREASVSSLRTGYIKQNYPFNITLSWHPFSQTLNMFRARMNTYFAPARVPLNILDYFTRLVPSATLSQRLQSVLQSVSCEEQSQGSSAKDIGGNLFCYILELVNERGRTNSPKSSQSLNC